jgi:hypothetical protein
MKNQWILTLAPAVLRLNGFMALIATANNDKHRLSSPSA